MPSTTRTKRPAPARAKSVAGPRGDFAYEAILRGIADGTFKPGERMREVAISEWLGISRTPVREGLRRLEADGLLAHTPHAGMLVTPIDRRMVAELYDMREVLEGTAARLAAENATRTDIDALNALTAQESRLPVDPTAAARHNRAFHAALYQCAHNRYLLKSLRAIADALLLLGPTTLNSARRQRAAHTEHCDIVLRITRRDADGAETVARVHIKAAYRERLKLLFQDAPRRTR
ncbi:MAG: GntR family transcriptional regulator [Betaproteobacteria bacterium]